MEHCSTLLGQLFSYRSHRKTVDGLVGWISKVLHWFRKNHRTPLNYGHRCETWLYGIFAICIFVLSDDKANLRELIATSGQVILPKSDPNRWSVGRVTLTNTIGLYDVGVCVSHLPVSFTVDIEVGGSIFGILHRWGKVNASFRHL